MPAAFRRWEKWAVVAAALAAVAILRFAHAPAPSHPVKKFVFPATRHDRHQPVRLVVSGKEQGEERYVGSQSCKRCHGAIYEAWAATRHSYSVRTADEAKRAGYILPRDQRDWSVLSYVIGGRKRIAYADLDHQTLTASYQHRTAQWAPFPSKSMPCTPCHYTGVTHVADGAAPPKFHEVNIGCEACHGPGGKHDKTYRRQDIRADVSSRVCGECHTQVGRVLPKDEPHSTHDTVQAWNHDPHVTRLALNSHNRFCSRCHSPYNGAAADFADSEKPVFSEEKQNMTCVSCHDPHRVTNVAYRRDKVDLAPPKPVGLHVLRGNDSDISTSNYIEFRRTEDTCTHCHSGADRIDLDHGNATCTDCHNTFQYNRGRESRVHPTPGNPSLSCRQCHANGDHLATILFRDPNFLAPKYVHNLRKLPAEVVQKYGFVYAQLPIAKRPLVDQPPVDTASRVDRDASRGIPQIRSVKENPRADVLRHLTITPAYPPLEGDSRAAEELLARAGASNSKDPTALFYRGVDLYRTGRLTEAKEILADLVAAQPKIPEFRVALGMVHLANRNLAESLAVLEPLLRNRNPDTTALLVAGLGNLRAQKPLQALEMFTLCLQAEPGVVTPYFAIADAWRMLGQNHHAISALRAVTARHPDVLEAHYRLANLHKSLFDAARFQMMAIERTDSDSALLKEQARTHEEQALAELAAVLRLTPDNLSAVRQVGEIYRVSGRVAEAAEIFEFLTRRQPDEWLPLYRLATVRLASGSYAEAVRLLREAAKRNPLQGDVWSTLGLAYIRQNEIKSALEALRRAVEVEPFNPAVHINLGAGYALRGDLSMARRHLRRSTELGTFPLPRLHLAYTNLAIVSLKDGELVGARTAARHALHLYPDFDPAAELYARLASPSQPPIAPPGYVFHDLLELFGEVTTAEFPDE